MKRILSLLFALAISQSHAAGEYYLHGSFPTPNSVGSSSAMRAELDSIQAGFDKLPALSGNGAKICAVNSGGTGLEAITTTGTGNGVRATSPTLVTPVLGAATATSLATGTINAADGTAAATIANSTGYLTVASRAYIADTDPSYSDYSLGFSQSSGVGQISLQHNSSSGFGSLLIRTLNSFPINAVNRILIDGPNNNTIVYTALEARGNTTIGDATSDTLTLTGYVSGTSSFGTSAWPTTVLGKSGSRSLHGGEGVVALWNETAGVGNVATMYLGTKHASVSTAGGFATLKGGTEGSDYASFATISTMNSGGTLTEQLRVDSSGNVKITNGKLIVSTSQTPESASATCTAGTIAWDSSYMYVCISANTWKRAAIATW